MSVPSAYALQMYRPTRAVIDTGTFIRNVRTVMQHSATRVMGVIKADAYGHGAVPCAEALHQAGAAYVGVTLAEEALSLRAAGITMPILVLGRAPLDAMPELVANTITCTVTCAEDATFFNHAAREAGRTALVHVKVDTGMSRLGIQPDEVSAVWDTLAACPHLNIEGIFTHLAAADSDDLTFTHAQTEAFASVLALLSNRKSRPALAHACASAGIHTVPHAYYDMVRPGMCLYGGTVPHCTSFAVEPVMQLETRIAAIRLFEAGRQISYGATYTCQTKRRIAVIPIGYADGMPRPLSNIGRVLVHGQAAPVTGRVCMDMTMIDVTDIAEATEGSTAILFGNPAVHGNACPTINTMAEQLHALPYEILCGIGKRVPRVYI